MTRGGRLLLLVTVLLAGMPGTAAGSVVSPPFELPFSSDRGGVVDQGGTGTGFTLVDASSLGTGLVTSGLGLDVTAGTLSVATTAGLAIRAVNTQDNALGVTVPADGRAVILETSLVAPPAGSGGFEQAGLWYGTSEDDYVKLVIISRRGMRVHMLHERAGVPRTSVYGPPLPAERDRITLRLRIDTVSGNMTGAYALGAGDPERMGTWPLPGGLRESTAGGYPVSRAGISASHRLGPQPLVYAFDWFKVRCATPDCVPGPAPKHPDMGDDKLPVAVPGDGDEDGGGEPGGGEPGGGEPGAHTPPGSVPDGSGAAPPADLPVRTPVTTSPAPGVISTPVRPRLRLRAPRRVTRRTLRRRGLRVHVRCTGTCMTDVDLYAGPQRSGRRLGRVRSRPAGRIVVRLRPRALKRLSRVRRIAVRGRARFSDGSVATVNRRTRLARRSG